MSTTGSQQTSSLSQQLSLATISSLLAQGALIELGARGFFNKSPISVLVGSKGARVIYSAMGLAAAYRAVTHITGPNRDQIAKFDE